MRKSFVFLSILIIGIMAFADAKDRLHRLNEISAAQAKQVNQAKTK
ncbi:MAG: hypothetical protein LBK53_01335 [Heliobacteriaceae bacterium]|nr:hypothetical protein [Heliobacteriaceae bacterium]